MKPRIKVKQKLTAYVNRYSILAMNEDGSEGSLIGLAQQKRFARREKVLFYSDESRSKVRYSFRAEKVFDVHGKYFVEDASDNLLGMFKKDFTASLLNSTWQVLDKNEQVILTIKESSQVLAIFRRIGSGIPFIGEIVDLVVMLLKYHFVILGADGVQVGKYEKTTLFRDQYVLSVNDEAWSLIDERVYCSLGVALDALQSR